MPDLNDLAYWFPLVEAAGLPVPETLIVDGPKGDLVGLLDGVRPEGYGEFMARVETAVAQVGLPCFLRTGHTSGKHNWLSCCWMQEDSSLSRHVAALVEESCMGIPGLPTDTWVVRELLPTAPIFHCGSFGGLPVTREFRLFVRDGEVEHTQPYWPAASVAEAHPSVRNWEELLDREAKMTDMERQLLTAMAERAGDALGGYWSVDFMEDKDGMWWLIDCAEGDRSFRYDPEQEISAV